MPARSRARSDDVGVSIQERWRHTGPCRAAPRWFSPGLDSERRKRNAVVVNHGGCPRRSSSSWPMTILNRGTFLAISGSLRSGSTNTALLRAAARLAAEGVELHLYAGLATLPYFNSDLDNETPPAEVATFRASVRTADALLISSPEYAHGVPGVRKAGRPHQRLLAIHARAGVACGHTRDDRSANCPGSLDHRPADRQEARRSRDARGCGGLAGSAERRARARADGHRSFERLIASATIGR